MPALTHLSQRCEAQRIYKLALIELGSPARGHVPDLHTQTDAQFEHLDSDRLAWGQGSVPGMERRQRKAGELHMHSFHEHQNIVEECCL